jgi:hypothetical protein
LISDIVKGKLKYSGHCVEGFDVFLAWLEWPLHTTLYFDLHIRMMKIDFFWEISTDILIITHSSTNNTKVIKKLN